jgi:hypothetical protein
LNRLGEDSASEASRLAAGVHGISGSLVGRANVSPQFSGQPSVGGGQVHHCLGSSHKTFHMLPEA